MNEIQEHLMLIFKTSNNVQQHFRDKKQDDHIRFVYCGIQKIQKISQTFLMLYHQFDNSDEIEFSLGILTRSILMDMILMLKLKSIVSSYNFVSEELKQEVKNFCYSVIIDGIKHEIDHIHNDVNIEKVEKEKNYKIYDRHFPGAFDFSKEKPRLNLKKVMLISLSKFCNDCKGQNLNEKGRICSLYSYYSKYDHLSHLTSFLPTKISFEERKKKIDSVVVLMLMHLKDLLATAYDFNKEYEILFPYIEEIKIHLDKHYS